MGRQAAAALPAPWGIKFTKNNQPLTKPLWLCAVPRAGCCVVWKLRLWCHLHKFLQRSFCFCSETFIPLRGFFIPFPSYLEKCQYSTNWKIRYNAIQRLVGNPTCGGAGEKAKNSCHPSLEHLPRYCNSLLLHQDIKPKETRAPQRYCQLHARPRLSSATCSKQRQKSFSVLSSPHNQFDFCRFNGNLFLLLVEVLTCSKTFRDFCFII